MPKTHRNEGFNIQKNHGYELEHAYSAHDNATKCFYLLLQVAHAINQLMVKGCLHDNFRDVLGSLKNYYRRLAEAFRYGCIDPAALGDPDSASFQIRLDST